MPNVMVTLPNIGVLNAVKFGSCPLLKCRTVMLPKYESARLGGCKVNFAPGRILEWGKKPRKCICSVSAQKTAKDVQSLVGFC